MGQVTVSLYADKNDAIEREKKCCRIEREMPEQCPSGEILPPVLGEVAEYVELMTLCEDT